MPSHAARAPVPTSVTSPAAAAAPAARRAARGHDRSAATPRPTGTRRAAAAPVKAAEPKGPHDAVGVHVQPNELPARQLGQPHAPSTPSATVALATSARPAFPAPSPAAAWPTTNRPARPAQVATPR